MKRHFDKYWGLYFVLFIIGLAVVLHQAVQANEIAKYRVANNY